MRRVIVKAYSDKWPRQFFEETELIKAVLGENCLAIHHIGSTSVSGLAAKPIIDIMPVVKGIAAVDGLTAEFEKLGYVAKGENGLPGRRYFQKGGDIRTHHLHIYEIGNPEIRRHLLFRDYLRSHPDEAIAYGTLKQKLAEAFPEDIESYINGKAQFVMLLEEKARRFSETERADSFMDPEIH